MGAWHGGRCYETASHASAAAYAGVAPTITGSGELVTLEHGVTGWQINVYSVRGIKTSSFPAPTLSYWECDPAESVMDGVLLGFAVVGVWVAALAARAMIQAIRGGV